MSRHVNDIKNMLFDQPEFESDNDDDDDDQKDSEPIKKKKSTVETIVFRDRSKMKKTKKLPIVSYEIQKMLLNHLVFVGYVENRCSG